MKVNLVSNDRELGQLISKTGYFNDVQVSEVFKESLAEVLILSGKIIHFNDLSEIRTKSPKASIFYILPSGLDIHSLQHLNPIFEACSIAAIMPHLTCSEIVERIINAFLNEEMEQGPMPILFLGTHSGIGMTQTIHAIAKYLSSVTEMKVAVLGLNPHDMGTTQMNYKGQYLDQLKSRLTNRILTPAELRDACYYHSFYYLAGNRSIKLQHYYTEEEAAFLIDLATKIFDVVLIDGGSNFDNGLYAGAIKSCEVKYLITTQEGKGIKHWKQLCNEVLNLTNVKRNFSLLVNKYDAIPELPNSKNIAEDLGMLPLIAEIPTIHNSGIISETLKKNLYDLEIDNYNMAIELVSQGIIQRLDITLKPEIIEADRRGKKKIFGLLRGKSLESSAK